MRALSLEISSAEKIIVQCTFINQSPRLDHTRIDAGLDYEGSHQGGRLRITVGDSGESFDVAVMLVEDTAEDQYSGIAINILHSIFHAVGYSEKSNWVNVVFLWGDINQS